MAIDWNVLEERSARWANIVAAFPGIYCAWVLWDSRHTGGQMSQYRGFIFCLCFFAICVGLGLVLNFARAQGQSLPSEPVISRPPENSRITQVLSPLQIEAIELSGFLACFMERTGNRPEAPPGADWDGVFDHAVRGEGGKWVIKMQAAFEQECSPRINAFISRLERETGHLNPRLRNYKDHVHDFNNINTVRAQLWLEVLRPLDIDFQGER